MEFWVLMILALENKLEAVAESCTRQAEEASLALGGDTFSAFEKVIEINDKKRRIVNMKVLCDTIASSLESCETELLKDYVRRSAGEIAADTGASRSKVYRDIRRACGKAAKAIARLGFKEEEMARDYGEIALCARTYGRIKRLKSREKACVKPAEKCGDITSFPEQTESMAAFA